MRRIVALVVLTALAWGPAPSAGASSGPPYDTQRGLADRMTGTISALAGPFVALDGAVGVRRTLGPGTVRVRADVRLARAAAGADTRLCLIVEAQSWCGTVHGGGVQASPAGFIEADFSLPSAKAWLFEVSATARATTGTAGSVVTVERITLTPL